MATGSAAPPSTAVSGGSVSVSPPPSPAAGQAGVLPSPQELERARRDVRVLGVSRLAAQLVVPRQEGTGAAAAAAIRDRHVGGVAAFGNVVPGDPGQVRPVLTATNRAVQEAMRADGRDWPAFLAIDQEGGSVNRIGAPLTRFPAPMALGAARSSDLARRVGLTSGSQLRDLGYTVVMAPSADVTIGPADPTIGTRSPGSDPALVTAVAGALLEGYRQAGVLATLKHFPGHGSVASDSHLGVARLSAPMSVLTRRDLRPFAELAARTPAVMVGHIELTSVDRVNPATLSKPVVTGLLRGTQKFAGLVVTDALEMAAITDRYGAGEAAVRAVEAGCDVILIPADTGAAIDALVAAVRSGRLSEDRLVESAARMVASLRHAATTRATPVPAATAAQTARAVAAASITQLDGACGQRLVGRSITVTGGEPTDRAALTAAARAAGLGVGSGGTPVRLVLGDGYQAGAGAGAGAGVGVGAASGAEGREAAAVPGEVRVAVDRPYGLASGPRGTTLIATFGRTPTTYAALVDVLVGQHKAAGRLPVAVGRYPIGAGCR